MIKDHEDFHNKIVTRIRESTADNKNQSNILAEILGITRISAYRRLTGQIKFSIEEAAIIATHLNFSLDSLIGLKVSDNTLFELQHIDKKKENFSEAKVKQFIQILETMKGLPNSSYLLATNTLPFAFASRYEHLYKLFIYRWLYRSEFIKPTDSLSSFILSDTLIQQRIQYTNLHPCFPKTVLVIDNFLYNSIVTEINYLYNGKLINEEELQQLIQDIYLSINDLELAATRGYFYEQSPLDIYVYESKVDSTYSYIEYNDSCMSFFTGYSLNIFKTTDPGVCQIQKKWINGLKRYSKCISLSNELDRYQYFNKQRKIVEDITGIAPNLY